MAKPVVALQRRRWETVIGTDAKSAAPLIRRQQIKWKKDAPHSFLLFSPICDRDKKVASEVAKYELAK